VLHDEFRGEEIHRNQKNRHLRLADGSVDAFLPAVTRFDVGVSPSAHQALRVENAQVRQDVLQPAGVLVAVADE
jgi:hypothetical protein